MQKQTFYFKIIASLEDLNNIHSKSSNSNSLLKINKNLTERQHQLSQVNIKQMRISQVIRIWRVTLVSLYFQLHLRLSPVFTRILVKSLSPATAFCLMKTILFRRTFSQEEKLNTGCGSIQICHQTNNVCVCMCVCVCLCVCVHAWWFWINFSTYSDSPIIWCNSKTQKNLKKILADILWNFF